MRLTTLLAGAALAVSVALSSGADAKNILRWASQGDALTLDPMSQNEAPTNAMNLEIMEPLTKKNKDLKTEPALAVSWEMVEPTVWRFGLREGVRFHEGQPFTADDVLFSIERAQAKTSGFREQVDKIREVRKVDDYTVDLVTEQPNPILPDQLVTIMMMSRSWAEEHGVVEPQDFSHKEETYAVRHANGTGPFKLKLREPDIRTILVKNEDWWGLEQWAHNVDEIVYTPIANQATRVAALLSGELDFLLDPPVQDIGRIRNAPGIDVQQVNQIRTIFFGLDQGVAELRSSNIKGKNPFADKRVRQALYQAIDIDAIHQKVMRGASVPAGIITAPGVHGHTAELDERLPHDPEAAKLLLAEAGYPDGFEVKLDCPNDRYVNDEAICQAVVGMLSRIGVKVNLDAQSKSLHFPKIQNRTSDFYMFGWGVPTLDSHFVFDFLYASDGTWNAVGYANPKVDGLIAAIETQPDLELRDRMIAETWQIVKDEIAYLPLHHQVITWAVRENLELPIIANDSPQFRYARFK